jgi:hypothetical protein
MWHAVVVLADPHQTEYFTYNLLKEMHWGHQAAKKLGQTSKPPSRTFFYTEPFRLLFVRLASFTSSDEWVRTAK